MKDKLYDILKGRLLLSDDSAKNWVMLLFLSLLALIMIASSHSAERKIHEIAKKNNEVKEYRTRFVDGRSRLMKLKMESQIKKRLKEIGVDLKKEPPIKLVVKE
ncbi:FtsL-like putative cell division protein [Aquimarina agarilytica]|uniref:FtsL-like putative cell division protein n=1 Tax=Aquimarina agarilytica TaxID=1087449 RepID=UPI000289FE43|nr:FtsL-like putative cell division protein [Aquimarina agarilytica]